MSEKVAQWGKEVEQVIGKRIGVLVTDSVGRPFRMGSVGLAVASWGFDAWQDLRGYSDLYGYHLQHKELGVADSLAAMADLVMGNAAEGTPMVIIRGWTLHSDKLAARKEISIHGLFRPPQKDLFRKRDWSVIPEPLQHQLQLYLEEKTRE